MAEAIRGDIPEIAAEWLAPIAGDFEALTIQPVGETDEQFTGRVQAFLENIPSLFDKMNVASLEGAMYAANAEGLLLGIRGRINQANEIRSRRQRRTSARLGQ